ncbi:hypothetical protein SPURM210S_01392 [Streptomyces purpurascens]
MTTMMKPPSVMRQVGITRRQPVRFRFPPDLACGPPPGSLTAGSCAVPGPSPAWGRGAPWALSVRA